MEVLVFLVPLALALGLIGLAGFLWSLKNGQYDDLEGAGWRAIAEDEPVDEKSIRRPVHGTGGTDPTDVPAIAGWTPSKSLEPRG